MNEVTGIVLSYFIFFGWIPILALGKAISWIIEAVKNNDKDDDKDEQV